MLSFFFAQIRTYEQLGLRVSCLNGVRRSRERRKESRDLFLIVHQGARTRFGAESAEQCELPVRLRVLF